LGIWGNLVFDNVASQARHWLVPLARPDVDEDDIAAVVECLRTGWLTSGPKVKQFEDAFASFLGDDVHAIAVNSNTQGLLIALQALGIGPGDEVITSTNTFTATALSIVHVGARPVLVDIDPRTLTIDVAAVEAAITPRTRAIIPVHVGGLACDMAAIGALAQRHGLRVIEDAAHAFPAAHGERLIGNGTSDATVFSFYATKTITTGEGGMVTTPHADVARQLRLLRLHGIDKDIFARDDDRRRPWLYDVLAPGHKANMADMAAALGVEQLKKAWAFHERRMAIARRYHAAFADLPLVLPADAPAGDLHAWHLYVVRLTDDAPLKRDAFIERMAASSIQCGVHFIPLHHLTYWRERIDIAATPLPQADDAFSRSVSLPLFTAMSDSDIDYVIAAVRRLLA
jgi:dTDP-4-amino-4,6-dideoxygalactose transaminase